MHAGIGFARQFGCFFKILVLSVQQTNARGIGVLWKHHWISMGTVNFIIFAQNHVIPGWAADYNFGEDQFSANQKEPHGLRIAGSLFIAIPTVLTKLLRLNPTFK
jgi:hypothetical protein